MSSSGIYVSEVTLLTCSTHVLLATAFSSESGLARADGQKVLQRMYPDMRALMSGRNKHAHLG